MEIYSIKPSPCIQSFNDVKSDTVISGTDYTEQHLVS